MLGFRFGMHTPCTRNSKLTRQVYSLNVESILERERPLSSVGGSDLITVSNSRYQKLKRIADATIASLALLAFGPLMIAIAIAIRTSMGRPVLFAQRRPGLHERTFICLKFRT